MDDKHNEPSAQFFVAPGYDWGEKPIALVDLPPAAADAVFANQERVTTAVDDCLRAIEAGSAGDDILRFAIGWMVQNVLVAELYRRRLQENRTN